MFNLNTVVFDGTSPAFYFTNTSGWNTSSSIGSLSAENISQTAISRYIFIDVQIKHQYIMQYVYLTVGGKIQATKDAVQLQ